MKVTPIKDYKTEGTETITLSLTGSNFGGEQWNNKSISVEIADTSTPPTYKLSASAMEIDEGNSVTITLTTTNVDGGTEVSYVLTNNEEVGVESNVGKFTIGSNGTASVTFAQLKIICWKEKKYFH